LKAPYAKIAAALVLFVQAATTSPSLATGGFFTGNDLHSLCRNNLPACQGYVAGVVDDYWASRSAFPGALPDMFCMDGHMIVEQIADVVINYLNANPNQRQYLAAGLVTVALREAFPCR